MYLVIIVTCILYVLSYHLVQFSVSFFQVSIYSYCE